MEHQLPVLQEAKKQTQSRESGKIWELQAVALLLKKGMGLNKGGLPEKPGRGCTPPSPGSLSEYLTSIMTEDIHSRGFKPEGLWI